MTMNPKATRLWELIAKRPVRTVRLTELSQPPVKYTSQYHENPSTEWASKGSGGISSQSSDIVSAWRRQQGV